MATFNIKTSKIGTINNTENKTTNHHTPPKDGGFTRCPDCSDKSCGKYSICSTSAFSEIYKDPTLRDQEKNRMRLFNAAMTDDHVTANRLLLTVSANMRDIFGNSALHFAVMMRSYKVARELVRAGANASQPDRTNRTPLIMAIASGDNQMVSILEGDC